MVLADAYEAEHHAIEPPDPIEAIEVRMSELGIDRAGLGEVLGIASGRISRDFEPQTPPDDRDDARTWQQS